MLINTVQDLKHILIFKTNIASPEEKQKVGEHLSLQPHIEDWSVDMEDVDRVLRIVSTETCTEKIIILVSGLGFHCSELY